MRLLDSAVIEEGKIDLLFEGEEGWVLVDYKTDWVSEKGEDIEAFFRNKYAAQMRAYADALRARSIEVSGSLPAPRPHGDGRSEWIHPRF